MLSKLVLCLIAAVTLQSCVADSKVEYDNQAACDIIIDYTKRFVDDAKVYRSSSSSAPQKIGVGEVPYMIDPVITEGGPVAREAPRSVSSVKDWDEITRLSDDSVLHNCEQLEPWLSNQGVLTDEKQIDQLTGSKDGDLQLLRLAMPVFVDGGESALLFVSRETGWRTGAGIVAIYAQDSRGRWRQVDETLQWVT